MPYSNTSNLLVQLDALCYRGVGQTVGKIDGILFMQMVQWHAAGKPSGELVAVLLEVQEQASQRDGPPWHLQPVLPERLTPLTTSLWTTMIPLV